MKPKTIVFVHGAWHGKWCWDKYFREKFTVEGYEVITFDLPGHDKSGRINGINKLTLGDYVKALEKITSALSEPPIIVGHSMGGLIVQKYLEKHSCEKAVLMASIPPYGCIQATLKFARKSYFYSNLLALNLYGLVDSEKKSKEAFFSDTLPNDELKEYTENLCSESFLAFLNMLLPQVRVNNNSDIPILVIGAREDAIFSENDNKITANKFNADLIMFDDIAHDMMLDVGHERVSDTIIDWLENDI